MQVVLVRHGNTFEPGQAITWVGGRTDLPLTAEGKKQAKAAGAALLNAGLLPARIVAGPLERTRETAILLAREAGYAIDAIGIDERLREVDFGAWEGRTSDQIRAQGGGVELDAWMTAGRWPLHWPTTRQKQIESIKALLEDVEADRQSVTVLVSSNGIFRLLHQSIHPQAVDATMRTGRLSVLEITKGNIQVRIWNVAPQELSMRLACLPRSASGTNGAGESA